ncbi:hypothetical protein [Providencia phage PSTRCR_127]|nr:hypothetical protein [Providencia phage PSTRCR_127]
MKIQHHEASVVSSNLENNVVFGIDLVDIRKFVEANKPNKDTKFLFELIKYFKDSGFSNDDIDDIVICTESATRSDFKNAVLKSGYDFEQYCDLCKIDSCVINHAKLFLL